MISTLYKPIDAASEKSLDRLNKIAESDRFLAGIGFRCEYFGIDDKYPVVKSYSRACYLMVSQEMWDKPQPTDEIFLLELLKIQWIDIWATTMMNRYEDLVYIQTIWTTSVPIFEIKQPRY